MMILVIIVLACMISLILLGLCLGVTARRGDEKMMLCLRKSECPVIKLFPDAEIGSTRNNGEIRQIGRRKGSRAGMGARNPEARLKRLEQDGGRTEAAPARK